MAGDKDLTALSAPAHAPPRAPLAPTTGSSAAIVAATKAFKSASPRQREAYQLFMQGHSTLQVSTIMSQTRSMAPLSVVWNLLGFLDAEGKEFDDVSLLRIVEEVKGASKFRMVTEFTDFLEGVKRRIG